MTSPLAVPALALAAGALALGGCGGGNDNGGGSSSKPDKTQASAPPASAAGAVNVSADPTGKLAFDKAKLTAKAGKVTLDMKDPSSAGVSHGIAVEGKGVDKEGPVVDPGKSSTLTVSLKPGKYEFYCPVQGHKQGGMKGELTVR